MPSIVDGVPITGSAGVMLAGSGRLTGLAAIRDDIAVTYQNQLDEIARGLIEAFAESDQSATPSLPDAPGLFTYPGAPAMPASGTLLVGLAGAIRINPSVDPSQGGNLALLRDGGIAGDPAYVYNASGGSAYADRLNQYVDRPVGHALLRSVDAAAASGARSAASPRRRRPGCRRRASSPTTTPTTRTRCCSARRKLCPRTPASTSTRK